MKRGSFAAAYENLLRHAEKFGTDCVYETARGRLHRESDLATLKCVLRRIEKQRRRRGTEQRVTWASDDSPAISGDDVGIAVDRLAGDGLTSEKIAEQIGVTVQVVRRHLKPGSMRKERTAQEIGKLAAKGLVVEAISDELGLKDATVRRYLRLAA